MKILIDGLNFELARGTGIKTFTRSVMRALSDNGHQLDLLSDQVIRQIRYVSPVDSYLANLQTVTPHRIGMKQRILNSLPGVGKRFRGSFGVQDPDLLESLTGCPEWGCLDNVHVRPGLFTKSFMRSNLGLGMQPISSLPDVEALMLTSPLPVYLPSRLNVLCVHDVIPLSHPWLLARWEFVAKSIGTALKYGLSRSDKVICVSETTKRELIKRFNVDDKKLEVVYQPCRYAGNTLALTPTPTAAVADSHPATGQAVQMHQRAVLDLLNLSQEPFVLFAGAIEPKKNLLNVLRAIERNPAIPKLVVAGSFAWSSSHERAMIKRLGRRVEHLGFVSDEHLQVLQQTAAACVFASITEGFGLPALEAIWCGTPCVLSDIAVFRELFPNNAFFVNPYNPNDIGDALLQAIEADDDYKQTMARDVQQRFSMAQFANRLSSILN